MLTLDEVKSQAAAHQRVLIRPRVVVQAKTPEQKRAVVELVRRVMDDHYEVLAALKNR